tara:strand:- start:18 stop:344 length:327 start_codon:yes stop_codon:yes gene_type:complete
VETKQLKLTKKEVLRASHNMENQDKQIIQTKEKTINRLKEVLKKERKENEIAYTQLIEQYKTAQLVNERLIKKLEIQNKLLKESLNSQTGNIDYWFNKYNNLKKQLNK